ncbi:putative tetratricopeptide repeat protein 41 [Prionailurus iriomotensis]
MSSPEQTQKPIQPYICSTLSDFQEERDFLADCIFPQLKELCNSWSTYFKAVDLRWSALKAPPPSPSNLFRQHSCLHSQYLKLCLDYVNSCFPFFICMLGQMYGDFLPDHVPLMLSRVTDLFSLSTVEQNLYVAAKNGYPWVLENPNYSLTEFEVIQAAFLNESPFQYFYFRTGTMLLKTLDEEKEGLSSGSLLTDEEKLRIGKLKAKIISKGLRVRFHKDLHELGDLVFKDWSVVIEQLYPATLMIRNIDYKHNCERFYHEEFVEKCKEVLFPRNQTEPLKSWKDLPSRMWDLIVTVLQQALEINSLPVDKSILLLSGECGCGKSTLIANWVNYFKKKYPSMLVIPHFVGTTCESSDIMSVMHCFITELQFKNYGTQLETDVLNEGSNVLVFSLLVEVFIASINLKPCILVLDGIEELIGIYGILGQKCISHCGLAEDEIFQLLDMLGYRDHYKVTMLHWAAFCNASRQWVQEKPNGLLYFRHQSLRSAVEHKLLGVVTPVRESRPYTFQNPTNHKKTHFHRILVQYFQWQTTFWRVFEELPWHLLLGGLCSFLSSPSITDSVSKIQNLSFWTWLHLIHYWNVLAEVGYDAAGAYLLTVAKVKAEKCHKMRKRHTPSALMAFWKVAFLNMLECRLFEVTTMDKCRLMFFIAKFLKLMGKINEAEGLFLTVENMLVQSRVLNNLVKSASEKYLKENHILECATETSSFLDNNPCDQAIMKYTEGVLIFAAGDTSLAKMRLQECLNIRRSLFGEKNILVGEIMEFLADLLSFLPEESERCQRKQAIEYYKQVI